MGGKRCAGLIIYQLLGVSVVRADEQDAVCLLDSVHRSSDTGIHRLDRFDRRIFNSRMANHIRVGKIDDDNVILSGFNRLHQLVADSRCAHLRLKIVGSHLRRRNQDSILSLVRLLHSAVEEEGNMGILLCLGDSRLGHIMVRKVLAKGIHNGFLLKCNQLIRDRIIVIGKAYIR